MDLNIKAVAFDIDGTLYPEKGFYSKVWFYYLRHISFFLKYSRVRKELRNPQNLVRKDDFYAFQASLMAEKLKCTQEEARRKLDRIVYEGLKPYYLAVKPFNHLREVLELLKQKNFKTAVLSDFPVEQKGDLWGLESLFDVKLCTEKAGVLKPSRTGFDELSKALGVKNEEILYVGNSFKYDVLGAGNAGMKTAWITRKISKKQENVADIVFSDYRQFKEYML